MGETIELLSQIKRKYSVLARDMPDFSPANIIYEMMGGRNREVFPSGNAFSKIAIQWSLGLLNFVPSNLSVVEISHEDTSYMLHGSLELSADALVRSASRLSRVPGLCGCPTNLWPT